MSFPKLIGLYASAPGSGKTTVARYLRLRHSYMPVSFASPLKRMLAVFLNSQGFELNEIQELLTRGKNDRLPELGVSIRHLMQTLGSEWGRECISPDIWLRSWERTADRYMASGNAVVVPDLRFANEAQLIHRKGGAIWRIDRISAVRPNDHLSEGLLDGFTGFDAVVKNNGTEPELESTIANLLQPLAA